MLPSQWQWKHLASHGQLFRNDKEEDKDDDEEEEKPPENRSDDINATEKSIMMKKEIKKLIFLSAMMLGWHRVVWGAYTCTYNPYTVYNVLYLYAFNSIHTYTLYIYMFTVYGTHFVEAPKTVEPTLRALLARR